MTRHSRWTNERPVVIKVFATSEKRLVAAILREPLRPSIWAPLDPAGRKDMDLTGDLTITAAR